MTASPQQQALPSHTAPLTEREALVAECRALADAYGHAAYTRGQDPTLAAIANDLAAHCALKIAIDRLAAHQPEQAVGVQPSNFDIVARAMDLAAMYAGSVAMGKHEEAADRANDLRAYLLKYLPPSTQPAPRAAEPVAEIVHGDSGAACNPTRVLKWLGGNVLAMLPIGTKLYAAPAQTVEARAQPVAWVRPEGLEWLIDQKRGPRAYIAVDLCRQRSDDATMPLYAAPVEQAAQPFQQRVGKWVLACFGETIARDKAERNHRFLEEALELVQACGCTVGEAHQLVDYTFGRPVGDAHQEVGGVMVTLAALCSAQGLDVQQASEDELVRIWTKVEQIRAKQAAKPKHSPLPEAVQSADEWRDAYWNLRRYVEGKGIDTTCYGPAAPRGAA
jgi:hypothetical protein